MRSVMVTRLRLFHLAAIAGISIALLLLGLSTSIISIPALSLSRKWTTRELLLLVPATASNINLCKLLFSVKITGFPDPVLLGWNGHGPYDGAKSHLFKVSEALAYLSALPRSSDEDLVLILDGYDIWLQLRPEVLISRYLEVTSRQNERLQQSGLFAGLIDGVKVHQSIVFGPDKTCWPTVDTRFACWGVPKSPQAEGIYGPETDRNWGTNRARWLNSGSIMGPVKDVRDMLAATMRMIDRGFEGYFEFNSSDQYYFQEVWAEQEYNRLLRREGKVERPQIGEQLGALPDLQPGSRTEFHMTIDYEAEMFQTSAYFSDYMTWKVFNQSDPASSGKADVELNLDVLSSAAPFSAAGPTDNLPTSLRWEDVSLGTNINTRKAFPLYHVTGIKQLREEWWPRMWWHPFGEALLRASQRQAQATKSASELAMIGGTTYTRARPMIDGRLVEPGSGVQGHVAAWSDQAEHLSWEALCSSHEDELFLR